MLSLFARNRRERTLAARPLSQPPGLPAWAASLFACELAPCLAGEAAEPLIWSIKDDASSATISDQFKANAEDYHQRYAASDHFERLFRQALDATPIAVPAAPRILDLGTGSGVNSVVPCLRLFPGANVVATDLSGELLLILAHHMRQNDLGGNVVGVVMDAMGDHVAPGGFDLVTGASILHHLERPEAGLAAAFRALKPGGHAIFFEPFEGWAIMRLAYERILAEADLRSDRLEPAIEKAMRAMVIDIAARSLPDTTTPAFAAMDDKWLFTRQHMEARAREVGFAAVHFVPHKDHDQLYQNVAVIQMRLATGRTDVVLPHWATDILSGFDAAVKGPAKRLLMLEGTIVLTKPPMASSTLR